MFSIRILPMSEAGSDSERLAEIVVGEFRERFVCFSNDESAAQIESRWQRQLRQLVAGKDVAILSHDPKLAWVVYREGNDCYIRQVLSIDGTFLQHTARADPEPGREVSEWRTNIDQIKNFVGA